MFDPRITSRTRVGFPPYVVKNHDCKDIFSRTCLIKRGAPDLISSVEGYRKINERKIRTPSGYAN